MEQEKDKDRPEEGTAGPEPSFAQMLESGGGESPSLEPGQAVEAVVVKIGPEWIFLDTGSKGEGILDRKEFTDAEGKLGVAEGERLRVYFVSADGEGQRFTGRIGSGPSAKAQLEDAFRNKVPVEGLVAREIKGGFEVRIADRTRAFCPFSQMALKRVEAPAVYVGRRFTFLITEYGAKRGNIVLSRRPLLEEERRKEKEVLKGRLREGLAVAGKVTSIRDFGAFVDIGGLEGLIPLSEMAWSRVENVHDHLAPGQDLQVVIKQLDWDADRITLSLRDAQPDPWKAVAGRYPEGSVHAGKVARLAPFGAFVTLEEGVDGLIHVSRLGQGKRLKHPREAIKEGETVEVRVEGVDVAKRRLSLVPASSAEAEEPPKAQEEYRRKGDTSGKSMGTLGDLLKARMGQSGTKK